MYLNDENINSCLHKEDGDAHCGHLCHDMDSQRVSLRGPQDEEVLTPYALQEKKVFMSFVKGRSLSYFPTTSRNCSATLTWSSRHETLRGPL